MVSSKIGDVPVIVLQDRNGGVAWEEEINGYYDIPDLVERLKKVMQSAKGTEPRLKIKVRLEIWPEPWIPPWKPKEKS